MKRKETADIQTLADHLDRLTDMTQFDEGNEKQSGIVAEGLSHISESAAGFQELFARLRSPGLTDEQRLDILWDIGEELRHINYHVQDMAYFDSQINDEDGDGEKLDS